MSAIKPGDMVMLVWACCEYGRRHLGWTGTVVSLCDLPAQCDDCGAIHHGAHAFVTVERTGYIPLPWLIKVEPPSETKTQTVDDEVTA